MSFEQNIFLYCASMPKLAKYILLILVLFAMHKFCNSQDNSDLCIDKRHRVMFYNVENHFDYLFDSTLIYNEYTPEGDLHWTKSKYLKKRNNIYKVINAVGGWEPVSLIGLAEIENEFVVDDLIKGTPLSKQGYRYIHHESKDKRGIDVALIYNSNLFTVISHKPVSINDPSNPKFTTRDMLYVAGILGNDTVHVFVVHWTSRYRGLVESQPLRILASQKLLEITDSICSVNDSAFIILMGDFNDNPENESMTMIPEFSRCGFTNMEVHNTNKYVDGTLKYKHQWYHFDQILLSNSLLRRSRLKCDSIVLAFDADFLLVPDKKFMGYKTNRTNIGFKYNGGFSDHLPVYFDIVVKEVK